MRASRNTSRGREGIAGDDSFHPPQLIARDKLCFRTGLHLGQVNEHLFRHRDFNAGRHSPMAVTNQVGGDRAQICAKVGNRPTALGLGHAQPAFLDYIFRIVRIPGLTPNVTGERSISR